MLLQLLLLLVSLPSVLSRAPTSLAAARAESPSRLDHSSHFRAFSLIILTAISQLSSNHPHECATAGWQPCSHAQPYSCSTGRCSRSHPATSSEQPHRRHSNPRAVAVIELFALLFIGTYLHQLFSSSSCRWQCCISRGFLLSRHRCWRGCGRCCIVACNSNSGCSHGCSLAAAAAAAAIELCISDCATVATAASATHSTLRIGCSHRSSHSCWWSSARFCCTASRRRRVSHPVAGRGRPICGRGAERWRQRRRTDLCRHRQQARCAAAHPAPEASSRSAGVGSSVASLASLAQARPAPHGFARAGLLSRTHAPPSSNQRRGR